MSEELETSSGEFDLAEYDIRQRWRTRPPKEFPAKWACEWGFDEYGLWQTFEIATGEKRVSHKMRYIPLGSFIMGSPGDEAKRFEGEGPQHQVTLTQGFWLGETTVAQALWEMLMGENPSHFKEDNEKQLPIENVSWHDCQQFCKKLSDITKAKFTLPTDAQWEYACRAGTKTPFNTGEQLGFEQGNYDVNYPYTGKEPLKLASGQQYRKKTIDVNLCKPNGWGLKQMHGNVWEWCLDGLRDYSGTPEVDPLGSLEDPDRADSSLQGVAVLRGGSWANGGLLCRSAYRFYFRRDYRLDRIGLRVAMVEAG